MPHRRTTVAALLLAAGVGAFATAPASAQLVDTLKNGAGALGVAPGGGAAGALSGLGLPSLGGASTGNIAGLVQYCVQNQLVSASSGQPVSQALASKLGGNATEARDPAYAAGTSGVLKSQGKDFSLSTLGDQAKKTVCDQVMQHAKSLI